MASPFKKKKEKKDPNKEELDRLASLTEQQLVSSPSVFRCWRVRTTRCQNVTVYFPLDDHPSGNYPKTRVKRSTCALSLWSEQHTIQEFESGSDKQNIF